MTEKLSPIQTELLSRADSIFASIGAAVGKATDFAATQIPDIAMQYVAYGRAYNTTIFLFSLLILFIGLFLFVYVTILDKTNNEDNRFNCAIISIPSIIVGILMSASNLSGFFMVWFAPKIWLITELVKLAK